MREWTRNWPTKPGIYWVVNKYNSKPWIVNAHRAAVDGRRQIVLVRFGSDFFVCEDTQGRAARIFCGPLNLVPPAMPVDTAAPRDGGKEG